MPVIDVNTHTNSPEGAPGWVRDHYEASDWMTNTWNTEQLAHLLPGVTSRFTELLDMLPEDPVSMMNSEFPIAAGIVGQGIDGRVKFVSRSLNMVNARQDSTAHAEMVALQLAQEKIGKKHLDGFYLLSTCEPCAMCCGAIENTGLSGVIFSATQADMAGKHARVGGGYKPFRTSPEGFSAVKYLLAVKPEMIVVSGLARQATINRLSRVHGGFSGYYIDPDA